VADIIVPTAPALATIANVELMHAGQWDISTGRFTFTSGDFYSAVAALDCPAVRRPVLKLGHMEPDPDQHGIRWDGEPAVGWISNMAVAEGGHTLVGDYTGMPGWLGDIIASAYPDRSVEGQYDFRCQLGHQHPFVLTAVALLGVASPGIGTLQSLQDVAALYGVAAASDPAQAGTPFALTIHAAAREDRVPNPTPDHVTATVTSEDVRRAFYDGRPWELYIQEMQLGPDLQLIVCDDSTGSLSRVAVIIGDGDGEAAVSFGEPVKVVTRYEDATTAVAAGAADQQRVIRFASRAESRPGERPAAEPPSADEQLSLVAAATDPVEPELQASEPAPETAPADQVEESTTTEGSRSMDTALIRTALGLPPEATDEEVSAALTENGLAPAVTAEVTELEPEATPVEPVAPVLPEGIVTIDETALAELREQALQGVAARAQQITERRDRTLDDAIKAGKFPPVRREHWQRSYDLDPEGTQQALASLAPGLVPVSDAGVPGGAETSAPEDDDSFDGLFTRRVPTKTGA
jgi:hypothetical protein